MKEQLNMKEIMFAHFAGSESPEETKRVEHWLSDPQNREQYYEWLDEWEQNQLEETSYEQIESGNFLSGRSRPAWLKLAAVFSLTAAISMWYISYNHPIFRAAKTVRNGAIQDTSSASGIQPGGTKAFLTTASGTQIILNDVQNGASITQAGVQITKTQAGQVIYKFRQGNKHRLMNAADALKGLPAFNKVTTPRGGEYQLVLIDGTKVWLNAASSIQFPVTFGSKTRDVSLTGEAYFEVAKNKEKPFVVHTGEADIEVLGTHFDVNAYHDNRGVVTTLLEGSVRMHKGNVQKLLKPGQSGTAPYTRSVISVEKADTDQAVGWTKGYFVFGEETTIADIMKEVARWYDVDVEYQGNVMDRKFGGTVSRYKNITELLDNMELTHAIHYTIKGKKVTIME